MRAPLRFSRVANGHWRAPGREDTSWEIIVRGGRYGLIVAQWDRPDWWFDTLDDAMAFAADRDAAPPTPRSEWITEIPPEE